MTHAAEGDRTILSGDPGLVPPDEEQSPRDLRGRWLNFKRSVTGTTTALPRVLRLVWDASPLTTLSLFVATAVAGVVPAATAYVAKLLVNAVVLGIVINRSNLPDREQLMLGPWQLPVFTAVGAIIFLAVLQFGLFVISSVLGSVRNVIQQLLQNSLTMRMQLMVMEKAAALDLDFFDHPASYDMLRRAQTDSINRPVMMISAAFGLVQTSVTFATMIVLLVTVSPLLALLALVSPIPAFIADARYGWRGYSLARWSSRLLRRMTYLGALVTTDSYAKEVKLFGLSSHFIARYRLIAQAFYDSQGSLIKRRYMTGLAWGNLSSVTTSLTYVYVALQAIAGRLTLGDLTLYTTAAQAMQGSVHGLLSGFSSMYEHNLYLNNLFELVETKPRMPVSPHPVPVAIPIKGEIRFENVSFAYEGAETSALTDLSFTVKPDETIAIVGRNGAGKTSIFKLIGRLYDPTAGRILIDGVDIRDYSPEKLRAQIGAMFQDFVTYQATAAENIGLGNMDAIANRDQIVSASRQAGAHELIANLAEGYDTALGKWFEAGVNLSGGEWQKVALARAFMRDAKILLLDEPTSSLDAQAEHDLFTRLRSLAKGRTALYISHRLSTVRWADRILFLEGGRLVEEGTHEKLMILDHRYARLFKMQASAYTTGEIEPEDSEAASPRAIPA